jgi:broad specificity phosphatase PhoE
LKETHILLIRHAETSAPDVFHGAESDVGLSAWGERQAEFLGARLAGVGAGALYCSGMRRAIATTRPVAAACGLTPEVVVDLHERKIGPLSGRTREEGWEVYAESKRRWMAGDLEFTHAGGESFAAIGRRVLPILDSIRRRGEGRTSIVIAHGVVIRVALLNLLPGYAPADFDRIAIDFASINDLAWDGSAWSARSLNEVVAPSPARPVA